MTTTARPAEHYLHGKGAGVVVIVPARVAERLEPVLAPFRHDHQGRDIEVDNVLIALRVAAMSWMSTYMGTSNAPDGEPEPTSKWLGTSSASSLLGITTRAVRKALERGTLHGEISEGEWRIRRDEIEHYRQRRNG